MIDDYIDNGMSENDAVLKLGSIDEIAETIAEDIPLSSIANKKLKRNKKLSTLEIILIIVVLISLVIIFKTQLTKLVESIFEKIVKQANTI